MKEPRDLSLVIEQMLEVLKAAPAGETNVHLNALIARLQNTADSACYAPPESQSLWWNRTLGLLEDYVGPPQGFPEAAAVPTVDRACAKRVWEIFSGRHPKTEPVAPDRFDVKVDAANEGITEAITLGVRVVPPWPGGWPGGVSVDEVKKAIEGALMPFLHRPLRLRATPAPLPAEVASTASEDAKAFVSIREYIWSVLKKESRGDVREIVGTVYHKLPQRFKQPWGEGQQ